MKAIMILAAAMMMTTQAADAQTEKKLTNFNDTTFTLNEVTVKSSLPKSRVKGDAMRTIVNQYQQNWYHCIWHTRTDHRKPCPQNVLARPHLEVQ